MPDRPYLLAANCALASTALFGLLTASVDFTFLADDYFHLETAARLDSLSEIVAQRQWNWNRIPVWGLIASLTFASEAFEKSWWLMYVFYLCHTLAVGLMGIFLWRSLSGARGMAVGGSSGTVVFGLAVVVASFNQNAYEVLYWPTCMPYAVGALLLSCGLIARHPRMKAALLALSFLSYESAILPGLGGIVIHRFGIRESGPPDPAPSWLDSLRPWLAAVLVTIGVRAAFVVISGTQDTNVFIDLSQTMEKTLISLRHLFLIQFYGQAFDGLATAGHCTLIGLALVLTVRSLRTLGIGLIALVYISTAGYWLLGYQAIRAVYVSQVFLAASVCALLAIGSATRKYRFAIICALAVAAAGHVHQARQIFGVKQYNADILRERQQVIAAAIEGCHAPCSIEVERPDQGLKPDWVLHPDYWTFYFSWLSAKYGAGKPVTFMVDDERFLPL